MTKRKAFDPTRAGADALLNLLRRINVEGNGSFADDRGEDDNDDPRDYAAFSRAIEESILANVVNAPTAHKQGYLRGLADLFCMFGDGCTMDLSEWDPITTTEAAFIAPREMREVLARVQH